MEARDIEAELMRKVAYLPGGQDRAGVPLLVVPVGPDVAHLCHASESGKTNKQPTNQPNKQTKKKNENQHSSHVRSVLRETQKWDAGTGRSRGQSRSFDQSKPEKQTKLVQNLQWKQVMTGYDSSQWLTFDVH